MQVNKPTHATNERRQIVDKFVESPLVVNTIIVLILINAVTLGLETVSTVMAQWGPILYRVDTIILIVFSIELVLKFYAQRLDFFRSGWNLFDLTIVVIAWIPAGGTFSVLRALRILRVLRLLSVVPQMRRVIAAIGHSIPGMLSVVGVLSILFYVSAVLSTKLFGQHAAPELQAWFGTIGSSAYTLFQIMTLESWSMGIVRPVMQHYPMAWIFFVPFIIITSFAVLNLFIGIIVDAMQTIQRTESANETAAIDSNSATTLHAETIIQLNSNVQELTLQVETLNSKVEKLNRRDS